MSFFVVLLPCENSQGAWPWSKDQNLVTINGISYTAEDYMHWWENRSGKGNNVSHDIQAFIERKLLVPAFGRQTPNCRKCKHERVCYLLQAGDRDTQAAVDAALGAGA